MAESRIEFICFQQDEIIIFFGHKFFKIYLNEEFWKSRITWTISITEQFFYHIQVLVRFLSLACRVSQILPENQWAIENANRSAIFQENLIDRLVEEKWALAFRSESSLPTSCLFIIEWNLMKTKRKLTGRKAPFYCTSW